MKKYIQNFNKRQSEIDPVIIKALNYPYKRTGYSYIFQNHTAKRINQEKLNEIVNLKERIAVIAYGSNASPFRLKKKFTPSEIIPVVKGTLNDYDVVYAPFITSYGSVPATITKSTGTKVEVYITFLTLKQLKIMDSSEGKNYERQEFNNGIKYDLEVPKTEIYIYISKKGNLKEPNDIALKEIKAEKRTFEQLTQKEIQEKIMKKYTSEKNLYKFILLNIDQENSAFRKNFNCKFI